MVNIFIPFFARYVSQNLDQRFRNCTVMFDLRPILLVPRPHLRKDRRQFLGIAQTRNHGAKGSEQFLWSGFRFSLYRDSAEQYWHSLIGDKPALYVVCREDEQGELSPQLVTADYDEAGAYVEADDKVFSTPPPQAIYQALESYVLAHYQPKEKKVRKRKAWKKNEDGDDAFAYRPKI